MFITAVCLIFFGFLFIRVCSTPVPLYDYLKYSVKQIELSRQMNQDSTLANQPSNFQLYKHKYMRITRTCIYKQHQFKKTVPVYVRIRSELMKLISSSSRSVVPGFREICDQSPFTVKCVLEECSQL